MFVFAPLKKECLPGFAGLLALEHYSSRGSGRSGILAIFSTSMLA